MILIKRFLNALYDAILVFYENVHGLHNRATCANLLQLLLVCIIIYKLQTIYILNKVDAKVKILFFIFNDIYSAISFKIINDTILDTPSILIF